jgi:hypothetical protein
MKRSTRWFQNIAQQDTTSRMAILPVLAKTGPASAAEPHLDTNSQGQTQFKVGTSEVGGEEVVG